MIENRTNWTQKVTDARDVRVQNLHHAEILSFQFSEKSAEKRLSSSLRSQENFIQFNFSIKKVKEAGHSFLGVCMFYEQLLLSVATTCKFHQDDDNAVVNNKWYTRHCLRTV